MSVLLSKLDHLLIDSSRNRFWKARLQVQYAKAPSPIEHFFSNI